MWKVLKIIGNKNDFGLFIQYIDYVIDTKNSGHPFIPMLYYHPWLVIPNYRYIIITTYGFMKGDCNGII